MATIDGDNMRIEKFSTSGKTTEEVSQVQNYSIQSHPVLKAAVESIRFMLAGNLEQLEQSYILNLEGNQQNWVLNLEPMTSEIQTYISGMRLTGNDIRIEEIVTIQADGDESVLELSYKQIE